VRHTSRNDPAALVRSVPTAPPIVEPSSRELVVGYATAVLAALLIGLAVLVVAGSATGWFRIDTEMSGSMSPAIPTGSALVVTEEPTTQVHVGQTIAFTPPHPYPQVTVVHRVIAVRHLKGVVVVRTRGVANSAADPWWAVLPKRSTWHVVLVLPVIGTLVSAARNTIAQLIILALVAGALASTIRSLVARPAQSPTPTVT